MEVTLWSWLDGRLVRGELQAILVRSVVDEDAASEGEDDGERVGEQTRKHRKEEERKKKRKKPKIKDKNSGATGLASLLNRARSTLERKVKKEALIWAIIGLNRLECDWLADTGPLGKPMEPSHSFKNTLHRDIYGWCTKKVILWVGSTHKVQVAQP